MKTPDDKMNTQTRLAADYRRQLNRLRNLLLSCTPPDAASGSAKPSAKPISTQAFGGFLMLAQTEEQVRSYLRANPEAAKLFVQDAASWGGLSAPYPPEQMHAVDEANHPFFLLGWLQGGDPEKTA